MLRHCGPRPSFAAACPHREGGSGSDTGRPREGRPCQSRSGRSAHLDNEWPDRDPGCRYRGSTYAGRSRPVEHCSLPTRALGSGLAQLHLFVGKLCNCPLRVVQRAEAISCPRSPLSWPQPRGSEGVGWRVAV